MLRAALTAQYTITAVRCLKQEKIDENLKVIYMSVKVNPSAITKPL